MTMLQPVSDEAPRLASLLYGADSCLALRPLIGPNVLLPLINQKPNDKGKGLYPP